MIAVNGRVEESIPVRAGRFHMEELAKVSSWSFIPGFLSLFVSIQEAAEMETPSAFLISFQAA